MIRCCARAPGGARQERSEELFAELCALGPGGEWLADKDQRGHHDVELHQGAKDGSMKKKNADTEKFLPNANTFAGMILSCARREGGSDLARARELYDQHIKLAAHARGHLHHKGPEFVSEFQTTADILTGMIECCQKSTKMKQKMLRESLDFFRKLRDNRGRGLKPTVKVYNHLLWCCAREPVRANDLARAEQLFKELTAGGEEKLTHANGFPLIDHVSQGSGRGYLSDEVDWTLRPNVDTYNALLMACANVTSEQGGAHKRKAEMYYGMMKTEGGAVVPNEVTFEAMLRAEQRSPWPSKEKIEAWRNELSWYSRGYKDVLGEVEENPRLFEEEFGVSAAGFGSEILEDENDIVHTTRGSDWCDD